MELQSCLNLLQGLNLMHLGFDYMPHNPEILSRFFPDLTGISDLTLIGRDGGRGIFLIWNDPEGLKPVIYFNNPQLFGAVCARWQDFLRLIIDGVMLYELAIDNEYLIFSQYPGQESFQSPLSPKQMWAFHQSQASRLWNSCSGSSLNDRKSFLHDRQRTNHHFTVWYKKNQGLC